MELGIVGAKVDSPKLEYHKFIEDELILITPSGFWLKNKESIGLEELKDLPFILREKGSGSQMVMEKAFKDYGIDISDLKVVARLGSTTAVIQATKGGAGVSVVSRRAAEEDLSRGIIQYVAIDGMRLMMDFFLVLRKGRSLSPLCAVIVNFLLHKNPNYGKKSECAG